MAGTSSPLEVQSGASRSRRSDRERLPEVDGPVDFVALDFETANSSRGSICSIGVAIVRSGVVVDHGSIIVDPETDFSHYNTIVNGIHERDVLNAPTLPDVWPALMHILDGRRVCAHSASFDIGALRSGAARYDLPGVGIEVYCTWRIAKRVWPEMSSHGLGYVAAALDFDFSHHDAGEDALACARVALEAQRRLRVGNLPDLRDALGYVPASLTLESFRPVAASHAGGHSGPNLEADPSHPLYGKTLCFTGCMNSMARAEAAEAIEAVGATFKDAMSMKVDFLVIGDADYVAFADGWQTGKLKRAVKCHEDGSSVEIVAERDFLALLRS